MNEATIGSNALVLDTQIESNLGQEAAMISKSAEMVSVTNGEEYAEAGALLRQIKDVEKQIKEYWEPLRVSTKTAYDNVLARKKEMLDPVQYAEKIIKQKVSEYTLEQERLAREKEEQQRRALREAAEKKLEEAARYEVGGDADAAAYAMAEAEEYEDNSQTLSVAPKKEKVEGISTSKTYAMRLVDPSKVPVWLSGVELRPIDEKAILRLIKAYDGDISIPGVEIVESVTVSVRS